MNRPFQRIEILDTETLKGVRIVTTASMGTIHGVDSDLMDTGETSLALILEFQDGTEQMVAMGEETLDELIRHICTVSTKSSEQAAKLYKGFVFLREALTL